MRQFHSYQRAWSKPNSLTISQTASFLISLALNLRGTSSDRSCNLLPDGKKCSSSKPQVATGNWSAWAFGLYFKWQKFLFAVAVPDVAEGQGKESISKMMSQQVLSTLNFMIEQLDFSINCYSVVWRGSTCGLLWRKEKQKCSTFYTKTVNTECMIQVKHVRKETFNNSSLGKNTCLSFYFCRQGSPGIGQRSKFSRSKCNPLHIPYAG